MTLEQRLQAIHERIARAAMDARRDPAEITLVCVSKTFPPKLVREAFLLGERDFGENRVDELLEKSNNVQSDMRWHMIGQLQTRKVRKLIGKTALIHSVDRPSLAEEIARRATQQNVVVDVLIELRLHDIAGRGGAGVDGVRELYDLLRESPHIRVRGLMYMAPLEQELAKTERDFSRARMIYEDLRAQDKRMDILSMGMSGDFEAAIREGSTMVRIGTAVFAAT